MALASTIGIGAEAAAEEVRRQLGAGRRDPTGLLFRSGLLGCLAAAVTVLVFLLVDVWADGAAVLTGDLPGFLSGSFSARADGSGLFQALRGTLWIGVVTVLTFPVGVAAAVYLEEYAPRSRLTSFIGINIRNLAGVPSVVYGILALTFLVGTLRGVTGGRSVLSGALAVAALVLPIVIITSAEAIRAVPAALREGAFGIGATRWDVVRTQVLPYAAPGVLTGTVLALARALGEAAPLILVGAIDGRLVDRAGMLDVGQLRSEGFTALPIAIQSWAGRPLDSGFFERSAAAIVVLLVIVLAANATAIALRNRFERRRA